MRGFSCPQVHSGMCGEIAALFFMMGTGCGALGFALKEAWMVVRRPRGDTLLRSAGTSMQGEAEENEWFKV